MASCISLVIATACGMVGLPVLGWVLAKEENFFLIDSAFLLHFA
jgi:hypothetical protein